MLKGKSITEIAVELERQRKNMLDMIVPAPFLAMTIAGELMNKSEERHTGHGFEKTMPLTNHAHNQLAQHLGIPCQYYDRMRESAPDLLSQNVNTWLGQQKPGTRRMIRTLDGRCRAYLSDRYMRVDYYDMLEFLLPTIAEAGCIIESAEITETRLYIKALSPRITGEIKKGEIVQGGLCLRNSEVGLGRVEICPLVKVLACTNGMIVEQYSTRRNHVGRKIGDDELEDGGLFSQETIHADIRAFLLKARDNVRAALQPSVFEKICAHARQAAGQQLPDVELAIEDVTGKYNLYETERAGILQNLINGADTSKWGLVNAITATAHNVVTDYDRSTELERIGGHVLYHYFPKQA